jgi:hypothetical protein
MALQERLQHLTQLKEMFAWQEINVRDDLQAYINADKKDVGGQSHLGDDDDGGVAAALAVLSRQADQANGTGDGSALASLSDIGLYASGSDGNDDEDSFSGGPDIIQTVTREGIQQAVGRFFTDDGLLKTEESSGSETDEAIETPLAELNSAVKILCDISGETSSTARRRRATMYYALNSKRSGNTEMNTTIDSTIWSLDPTKTNILFVDVRKGKNGASMLIKAFNNL